MLPAKCSCIIIGNTSLLIRCAKCLISRNWEIKWIGSSDPKVIAFCRQEDIPIISDRSSYKAELCSTEYDYLFSIVNDVILDLEMISSANHWAINYHDALLPEHAGMHAGFWALYQQEKQHGITWHLIDEGIDTGDILVQKQIPISNVETTLSLHSKCYERAIIGFKELINGIEQKMIQPIAQNTDMRSYNALYKRPKLAGVINFDQPAENLLREIRAYDFGSQYANPIGTPKLYLEHQFYIIGECEILPERSSNVPNSIDRIDQNQLILNTKDNKVAIKQLKDIYGNDCSFKVLDVAKGILVNDLDTDPVGLTKAYRLACKQEQFWINKLLDLEVLEMPFIHQQNKNGTPYSKQFTIKTAFAEALFEGKEQEPEDHLCLLVLYLACLSDHYSFDIIIQQQQFKCSNLFADGLPFRMDINTELPLKQIVKNVSSKLKEAKNVAPFLNDIVSRYPILKNNISVDQIRQFNLSIGILADDETHQTSSQWSINYLINEQRWKISYPDMELNHLVADSFIDHFQNFVDRLSEANEVQLNRISLLSENEFQQIVQERNNRMVTVPSELCIHQLFEEQALRIPEEVAVVVGENSITYQNLNQKADRIASILHANGCKAHNHVGIYLDRNIDHIIAILGVLKAGACYVPLNPDYPAARLEIMIKEAGIDRLITNHALGKDMEAYKIRQLVWENIDFHADENPVHYPCQATDRAYIMFTSGSSGRPKGVPISHRNVVNFLFAIRDYIDLPSRRIGAVGAPFSFDVSVEEIFSTICFGGTAHIIPKDLLVRTDQLVDYLYQHKINIMFIIPTLLDKIAEHFTPQTIKYLECILSGLQPKKNKSFQKFRALSPSMKIINTYGPTEVTFGPCGYYFIGDEEGSAATPIGRPLANYEMYVVNQHLQVLPDFLPGELLIGGKSVSEGYLNYPDLNVQRFIHTSFGGKTKKYRSGDLVYSDNKGNVHFIGRQDNQVKIRGFRIEIGEVENAINTIETIDKCVVIAKKVNQSYLQLIAYLLFKSNADTTIDQVKDKLQNQLPDYAIPSFLIKVEEIPLFPNGKINYRKLPDPQQFAKQRTIIAPTNVVERELEDIWKKVLGTDTISTEDNFFEIGGDSLSAAEVIAQFQVGHKEPISIAMFYNFPSIKAFSNAFTRDARFFSSNPLMQLKEGEEHVPIYFVHGLNGSIAILNHIIDALEVPNAMYAFQAGSLYYNHKSLEELAQGYVNQIIATKVSQCVLCGFSFGGILAFEMAHQLNAQEIDVQLIALDSKPIIMYKMQKKWWYRSLYAAKVVSWLYRGWLEAIRTAWQYKSLEHLSIGANRIKKLKARIEPEQLNDIDEKNEQNISVYQEILLRSKALANQYQPKNYKVDLTLIKAIKEKEGFIGFGFAKNSWSYFTKGDIKVETVDIHHYDFGKEENARLSAQIIEKEVHSFNKV
ncbi:MAG: amino acid adenylation domain-containing protein [Chitinophagales bacterium]